MNSSPCRAGVADVVGKRLTVFLPCILVALQSCNCGAPSVVFPSGDSGTPSNGGGADQPHAGGGNGNNGGGTGSGDGGLVACAGASSAAMLEKRPVDVIFVVDNSGSMTSEIEAIERNINTNFANIVADAGIDYRVIMLSKHGTSSIDQSICISAPLSGLSSCMPTPQNAVNGARFFHYSIEIGSNNSFSKIIGSYDQPCVEAGCPEGTGGSGWSEYLRVGAHKAFIEITDDDERSMSYTEFDQALFDLSPSMFGSASSRQYTFHTIGGLAENSPPTLPWLPSQPLVSDKCTSNGGDSVNNSWAHQRLSMLTGGLRFPICMYTNFDAVFSKVAEGVIAKATVACEFAIPPSPGGSAIDSKSMLVQYTSGTGGAQAFSRTEQSTCAAGKFYVDATTVHLCPQTCQSVQSDPQAKIDVLFQCTGAGCKGAGERCANHLDCCSGNACLSQTTGLSCSGASDCSCKAVIN